MASRLRIGRDCEIPMSAIEWSFQPSGGPGGQHANNAHTRAVARLDLTTCPGIGETTRQRLVARLGEVVTVGADDSRSQHRNRALALERLRDRLAGALQVPTKRRPTRPTRASSRRRVEAKRQRGELKESRRRPDLD